MSSKFTAQELAILRNLFDSVDLDRSGRIHVNQLPGLVSKLGKTQGS
jgi:Ca2+-binding EF-hand superfamily protein